jgi:hypothetical protein
MHTHYKLEHGNGKYGGQDDVEILYDVMKEIEQYELDHELDLGPFMILRKDKSKMYFKPVVRKKNKTKTGLEGNDFKERSKSNGDIEEDGDDEKETHECEECHEKFSHSR